MLKHISAAIFLMVASFANAQVQIVESQPIGGRPTTPARSAPAPDASMQLELLNQLQMLQQEVLELRGLVEQQTFEIRQLKQQRLDDYLDLDRRLSQVAASPASSHSSSSSSQTSTSISSAAGDAIADGAAPAGELAAYRAAIDLVLKQRDLDAGANALLGYVRDFPSGHYSGNAYYWLGQIYLQKNDQAQSKSWFERMVEQYPTHQKAPEAKFKLARIYHAEGKTEQAKKLMQDVAKSDSTAAGLARDFLQQNF
jgi:tol-pal system protein YbgF